MTSDGGKATIRILVYSILLSIASMAISYYADIQTMISLNLMNYGLNEVNK